MDLGDGIIVKAKIKLISVRAQRTNEGKATTVVHSRHANGLNLMAEVERSGEIQDMFNRQGQQNGQVSWR